MAETHGSRVTRRRLLRAALALPVAVFLPRIGAEPRGATLPLTPSCGDQPERTPAQTAGPFYTPESPEKADFLRDDPGGEPLTLQGLVLDTRCRPLPGAVVDLWHADSKGRYDNDGFRLRGHQRADGSGAFRFMTAVPGKYPYRTRHYHVRIFAPGGGKLLTTQLYFPGEPANADDGLFQPELLMNISDGGAGRLARFDFVVAGVGPNVGSGPAGLEPTYL